MTKLKPFLEPVLHRQQSWRKWRLLAWCWGIVAVAAGIALILSASDANLPENTVATRLLVVLAGGSLAILILNHRKRRVDYRQASVGQFSPASVGQTV